MKCVFGFHVYSEMSNVFAGLKIRRRVNTIVAFDHYILTAKLLKQGYSIIKFEKHFLNSTTDTQS